MQLATRNTPTHRFFALNKGRILLARASRLSANDLLVWSLIEVESAPGKPRQFVLGEIAEFLSISADTVSRAIKRLVALGVISRQDLDGRIFLCPASVPGACRTGAACRKNDAAPVRHDHAQTQVETTPAAITRDKLKAQREKSFCLDKEKTELVSALEARFQIWTAKGARLVAQHGADRVREVIAWADFKDSAGQLRNPGGWLQAALEKTWGAPDGFHQSRQERQQDQSPLNRSAVIAQVKRISSNPEAHSAEEKTNALRQAAAIGEEEAARKLANDWGIDIQHPQGAQ